MIPVKTFWKKTDKSGPRHPVYGRCWVWLGGESAGADRRSWEIHYGPIPVGRMVCHSCDNPRCVNPEHLWLGTNRQNINDARMKGRLRGRARVEVDPTKTYGRLRVVRPSPPGHSYLCRCSCGTEVVVAGKNLTSNHTQSCGCYNKERLSQVHRGHKYNVGRPSSNRINRTGKRYGRLVARNVDPEDPRRWICKCDCGMTTSVLSTNLANYATNNRGCSKCQKQRP